jgi:zinc D-Ala-D-Ala dipeptidase
MRGTWGAIGLTLVALTAALAGDPPRGFVDAATQIPDLIVEMRYATAQNFIGRPIPGYKASRCLLTRQAAKALQCAADDLRPRGFVLKVYDCYRPQQAVDAFVSWGHNLRDQKMKSEFYPDVDKRNLFSSNYIATRSGHSRGSTLDLTIAPHSDKPQTFDPSAVAIRACDSREGTRTDDGSADMGTGFDCFSTLSHTLTAKVSDKQRENRALLRNAMRGCGFYNNPSEWWHYTLRDEPYPGTFFNFPVE